ncbi:hypothetical protein [Lysobacter panacisoli]|uniref:Sugar transporter n=1 Tax=Lysobacter panacisoli TaxID=1255263 RepID=A0ABP9L6H6_9GAMM|nr:hypothetical protein [Lysobacter panacisoli]
MTTVVASRPTSYWIIAVLALLWNLIGLTMFCLTMAATPEQVAAMPSEHREILAATPGWMQVAYGAAVIGGVLGAIGLLLRKRWATTFFLLSLVGLVVQCLGAFLVTPAWRLLGPSGLAMPVLLLAIALFLLSYARRAAARGWLR